MEDADQEDEAVKEESDDDDHHHSLSDACKVMVMVAIVELLM